MNGQVRYILLALGVVFLVFGLFVVLNYTFRMNVDRDWGISMLAYDLGFIGMGIAVELLGLGLVMLGRK